MNIGKISPNLDQDRDLILAFIEKNNLRFINYLDINYDEYTIEIKSQFSASAILHFPASTWMPCMKLLRDSNSNVYVAVSGRKSQFSNMVKYFINQIDQAIETYGDLFNGIYIHNLGNEGFFVPYLPSVVGYVKSKGLKIAFETYDQKFDSNTVRMADLSVVFKDSIEKYLINCGEFGPGPFCQNAEISANELSLIESDIKNGIVKYENLAAMVFKVDENAVEEISESTYDSIVGSVSIILKKVIYYTSVRDPIKSSKNGSMLFKTTTF